MELNISQERKIKKSMYDSFPFLKYIKGKLIDYVDPETKTRWTGHVAMYYKDTNRIRIDWENGATTYHNFSDDSAWIFKPVHK